MKNKSIWIGAIIGLILGLFGIYNFESNIGLILLFPIGILFGIITKLVLGPCSGHICDDRFNIYFEPLILFIPFIYAICGALIVLVINKTSIKITGIIGGLLAFIGGGFLILTQIHSIIFINKGTILLLSMIPVGLGLIIYNYYTIKKSK